MRVLLIASTTDAFGRDLKSELSEKNIEVNILDFESLNLIDNKCEVNIKYKERLSVVKRNSKIRMLYRMWLIAKVIKEGNFDLINIHVSRWVYLVILPWLYKCNFVITFYGSDFYQTSRQIKKIQTILYKNAKAITFTNPLTLKEFSRFYNDFCQKSYVCRFGLRTLEFIDKNRDAGKMVLKKRLGYNTEKIVVTCGYNSTKSQRQEKIIDAIKKISPCVRERCQFVFPMTYGEASHRDEIKKILAETDLDYIVFEDFMYADDNANIKLASDIMINLLETDSFSGSMQEFLYANNVVITGCWLPYDVFDEAGIQYIKIQRIEELSRALTNLIMSGVRNYDTSRNPAVVASLSSWPNTIGAWVSVYQNASV